MKASLIFFDTVSESANGTLRGAIGFASILLMYAALHACDAALFELDYKIGLTALLLCSSLGVFELESAASAVVLGALVSFVIFATVFLYNKTPKTLRNGVCYISAGMLVGIVANLMIWHLYWKNGHSFVGR